MHNTYKLAIPFADVAAYIGAYFDAPEEPDDSMSTMKIPGVDLSDSHIVRVGPLAYSSSFKLRGKSVRTTFTFASAGAAATKLEAETDTTGLSRIGRAVLGAVADKAVGVAILRWERDLKVFIAKQKSLGGEGLS